ncbi:DNA internalization-related competence protein ComEC/Rec2 [Hydrogenovibrio sp. SC-1]|uniref:DNA internalization-related competence protein ComEC/Rec2 n=1 Tax=Hydrogenovibrio sp. SC-1 TaxID=2065820 RepID=UPI000C7CDA3D|nr:DNA internalization-related competence protein ComEC/Rec2 [Hydrogenovibrio sp. SC-1]PLA73600.1 DNA internalization-related competence protein ComEC/Rec2 [Hydrogenovibrio sp. SC-1]
MFRYFVVGLVTALVWFYQLAVLPGWQSILLAALLLVGLDFFSSRQALISRLRQIIIGFLSGFIWVFLMIIMSPTLSKSAYFAPIEVMATIVERPEVIASPNDSSPKRLKLVLQLSHWHSLDDQNDQAWSFWQPQIQLNWYHPTKLPQTGEQWRFRVKLKPPQGSLNLGGFDYEAYLYEKGIRAKGYVLNQDDSAMRVAPTNGVYLRESLAQHLAPLFETSRFKGIFQALVYGDKAAISKDDWQLLRQTGTVHLMVISGLHIGIMAAFGFALFALIWRGLIRWTDWHWVMTTPRLVFGSVGAIIIATLYMSLAGYSIPTQRAWMMVVVVACLVMMRRQFQPWSALALAAALILLWHPSSVLSSGFWLSFIAVAIIFKVLSLPKIRQAPAWQKMLWVQLSLTIGMIPVLAGFYQQFAVGSLIANLIAVPFVSLVGLPLLFLTVGISFISYDLAQWMMTLHEQLWQLLWWGLNGVAESFEFWQTGQLSFIEVAAIYGGIALLVTGGRLPLTGGWKTLGGSGVVLGLVWMLWPSSPLALGEVRMTVLDVGQGQAIVFETRNETIIYDAGPKWTDQFDGAQLAILPYLKSQRRQQLDLFIVSHSDQDHAGGTASLWNHIAVLDFVSGQAKRLNQQQPQWKVRPCENGQAWLFSGVKFEILSPEKGENRPLDDNDTSCLLKVSTSQASILVPGDLTEKMERQLVDKLGSKLKVDLLVAGHHGSQTSTSQTWLDAISPSEVVISSGFANRYGFPSQPVIDRLKRRQIPWRNTACDGAIQYKIIPNLTKQTTKPKSKSASEIIWLGSEKQHRAKWFYSRCDAFSSTSRQAYQP